MGQVQGACRALWPYNCFLQDRFCRSFEPHFLHFFNISLCRALHVTWRLQQNRTCSDLSASEHSRNFDTSPTAKIKPHWLKLLWVSDISHRRWCFTRCSHCIKYSPFDPVSQTNLHFPAEIQTVSHTARMTEVEKFQMRVLCVIYRV